MFSRFDTIPACDGTDGHTRGHTKKCDQCVQCVQCDRPVPAAEGQGGALTTPDGAISHEQEMGSSGRGRLHSRAVRQLASLLIGPLGHTHHTGRFAAHGTDQSHCTHWSQFLGRPYTRMANTVGHLPLTRRYRSIAFLTWLLLWWSSVL